MDVQDKATGSNSRVRSLGVDCSHASILDVGSGTGFYLAIWKELGCKSYPGLI